MSSVVYKSTLNVGNYEIQVEIIEDEYMSPLEYSEITELNYNPLPSNQNLCDKKSPFDYTDFAIDNFDHKAYFATNKHWNNEKMYFVLPESVNELKEQYSKLGYAKHDAYLIALKSLKHQARYVQSWYDDEWYFVGFLIRVTESFTDDSGLIWSHEIEYEHDSLWGIEWSIYLQSGDNCLIDNEQQFKTFIPKLLPKEVVLTDDQLNELWYNLTSP